jgi:hypothetical protein
MVSLHDDLVSLHGSMLSLYGAMVSHHGAIMSHHGAMVSLHGDLVRLHGAMLYHNDANIICSGAWGGIIVPVPVSETTIHKKNRIFKRRYKYRHCICSGA